MKKFVSIIIIIICVGIMATLLNSIMLPRKGKATWYSSRACGVRKRTANNERFNDGAMTCAMWGVAFNRKLKVINIANGKSVIVRVNDRGPHKCHVRRGVIIDLTKAAFKKISPLKKGVIDVIVKFL